MFLSLTQQFEAIPELLRQHHLGELSPDHADGPLGWNMYE